VSVSAFARDEQGQSLFELAFGLPLFVLAALFSFALLDAATTQEAVEAGARRAASVLAGSNDDAQATGAAGSAGWLRGQAIQATFDPAGTQTRCPGTPVRITVRASGHLGFLLIVPTAWTANANTVIESAGAQSGLCP
jgi:hypothetical protein